MDGFEAHKYSFANKKCWRMKRNVDVSIVA